MNGIRKMAKNLVNGDLILRDGIVMEVRADAAVYGGRRNPKALVAARKAHVGKGRLHNLVLDADRMVKLAPVGYAYIAA